MIRKPIIAGIVFFMAFMALPSGICQTPPDVPSIEDLEADSDSISITWTDVSDADIYYIWGGTESDNLSLWKEVAESSSPEGTQSTTIEENIEPGTTYHMAVSAVDERTDGDIESDRSRTETVETQSDTEAPAIPTGFGVTDIDAVTESSVDLQWDESTESDLDSYKIEYGPESNKNGFEQSIDAGDETTATVTGLSQGTRYFFTITAIDDSENESSRSATLVVDTLPDQNPPHIPAGIDADLTDEATITVTVESSNENMADFAGNIIYYGQTSGALDQSVDIGKSGSRAFTDLPQNSTWYFAASAYDVKRDGNQNESQQTDEISATVEETRNFLDQSDEFQGGCFIGSLRDPEKNYNPGEDKNKTGVAAGYYLPEQSEFEDFYGNDNYPVFLFYDRLLTDHFSVDLKAGYLDRSGNQLTLSGEKTKISSDYTLVPVAASINYNFPITRYIWAFAGLGPDYWFVEEETKGAAAMESSDWVGGYHARTGLWLYNRDPRFQNWGGLIEIDYSRIDRFGGNDSDIGGWFFLLGLFYSF
ncbi:MAG: fibronectin type III domain-containing protein [Thermodesulfobacteriota bacterium]